MRISMSVAVLVLLAACGQEQSRTSPAAEQAGSQSEQAAEAPVATLAGADLLAQWGVDPGVPYSVAYDFVDRNRAGTPRHRVLIEVTGGTMDDAAAGLERSLLAGGYRKDREVRSGGKLERVFRKKGVPTLVVSSQAAGTGPKLKRPDAVGSIHLMWNKG